MTDKTSENEKKPDQKRNPVLDKILKDRAPNKDVDTQSNDASISIEKHNEIVESLKKKVMYALAEAENTKRNAEKEIAKIRDFAISEFAKDLLTSVESLEKAVLHMKEQQLEGAVFEGPRLTLDAIFATLKKNGIEKVSALGAQFDHNLHQAVSSISDASLPDNTVYDVLQDGYTIKGRLLRPAIVVVVGNKGGAD